MERTKISVQRNLPGIGAPESIHLKDEKREKRRVLERSIDDEVYGEFYK